MKYRAILFDLDGTLLPIDFDAFTAEYYRLLRPRLEQYGFDPRKAETESERGFINMIKNDGLASNEEVFRRTVLAAFPETGRELLRIMTEYYSAEFRDMKRIAGFQEKAAPTVRELHKRGYTLVLATQPVFPRVAAEERLTWAGLSANDFDEITTFQNSRYCKPNPAYYREIMNRLGLQGSECLMVGNDLTEDTAAEQVGATVFLLTHSLIERQGKSLANYPHGDFDDLLRFIDASERN